MSLLRRHWVLVLTAPLLGGVVVMSLIPHALGFLPARADSMTQSSADASAGFSEDVYLGVNQLRNTLGLTTINLAAMGCNQDTAAQIIKGVSGWYRQNKSALDQADANQSLAAQQLGEAVRRINIGPRDESVLVQVQNLKQAVVNAKLQRQQLLANAADNALMSASSDQRQNWAWLKLEEQSINVGVRRSAAANSNVQSIDARVAARLGANREAFIRDVQKGEDQALPMPEKMKIRQQMMGTKSKMRSQNQ